MRYYDAVNTIRLYDYTSHYEAVNTGLNLRPPPPQNLAHLAWAFATAGYKSPALFDAMARKARLTTKKMHLE